MLQLNDFMQGSSSPSCLKSGAACPAFRRNKGSKKAADHTNSHAWRSAYKRVCGFIGYSLSKVLEDAFKASATTPEEQELRTIETDATIEYAEVIGYDMAIQLATRLNIGEAVMPLRQNLQEEEKMVVWMRANLPSNFVQLWSKIDHEQRSQ